MLIYQRFTLFVYSKPQTYRNLSMSWHVPSLLKSHLKFWDHNITTDDFFETPFARESPNNHQNHHSTLMIVTLAPPPPLLNSTVHL
jgi:hypothetical protein